MSRFVLGTSGYSYQHWKGVFYPPEVKQAQWLEFYAREFGSVELNVTFYNLPKRETFESWRERTPEGFRFAVKGWRAITHYRRLHDAEERVRQFFDAASGLGTKLDIVLWQLPPKMSVDVERLDAFCAMVSRVANVRQAFEFRDDSWFTDEVYETLRRHGCALCVADRAGKNRPRLLTTDYTYLRFHGGTSMYVSKYTPRQLEEWAAVARGWLAEGVDVYAYFNNDAHGYALDDARRLRALVEGTNKNLAMRRPVGRA
jgi:uncharacterized protein YecE (DUF72 family)